MSTPTSALLLHNMAGQVIADPAGFLRLNWSTHARTFGETCAMFTTAAAALQRYGWERILVNQLSMRPFTPQEQQWISTVWLPYAVKESHYRFGAVVVASNLLTRLATSYITTSTPELPLRYRSFDREETAISWLLMQSS
ncbi:hypothetical protein [Hymenobacter sp. BRD67]|uniref:hypothetical protein n=1 Tax=Hymenobacter sp. BRD67 TaxID=2675877 RepID=UPI0015671573|nr:hypothetical protein [Hymenobacter sp. BRD67]QKG52895.1 hypothetical protein GKZ67_10125 [Hymenobacter sp. BRD67]